VHRRIGLQYEAGRSPRFLLGKIAQTNAAPGAKRQGIVEDGMNLRVPRYAENVPFIEINDRSGFPQPLLIWIRVFEEVDRKRIDVEMWDGRRVLKGVCRLGETLRIHDALPYEKWALVLGVTFNDGIKVIAKPTDRQPATAAV
jgi:hypothetical protein